MTSRSAQPAHHSHTRAPSSFAMACTNQKYFMNPTQLSGRFQTHNKDAVKFPVRSGIMWLLDPTWARRVYTSHQIGSSWTLTMGILNSHVWFFSWYGCEGDESLSKNDHVIGNHLYMWNRLINDSCFYLVRLAGEQDKAKLSKGETDEWQAFSDAHGCIQWLGWSHWPLAKECYQPEDMGGNVQPSCLQKGSLQYHVFLVWFRVSVHHERNMLPEDYPCFWTR